MKRALMLLVAGTVLLGTALSAKAQGPTVSFGGQMRVFGFWFDNMSDFKNTSGTAFKDSNSFYFQRFRLFTTIESADKKAKAYWALEIGDIVWGNGGGASGNEYGASGLAGAGQTAPFATGGTAGSARVGNGSGGSFGADGINVETKNLYLQFEVPGLPSANVLLGIAPVIWLDSPVGPYLSDDGAQVQVNWKGDPVDLQLYTVKVTENTLPNADDNDMYAARVGVNVTKDLRFTVEGLGMNAQCFARRPATTTVPAIVVGPPGTPVVAGTPVSVTTNTGTCVSTDIFDNFWIGGTVGAKLGTISLDGSFVYGQRQLFCPTCGSFQAKESGWGFQGTGRLPIGPVQTWLHAWYTSGDKNRGPGSASNGSLGSNSDKLPIPVGGASWAGAPFIAEWLFGLPSIGGPAPAGTGVLYADYSGTFGGGMSASYALTPELSVGGGLAYVGASDAAGLFGDWAFEFDGGIFYQLNANLSIRGMGGYLIPDKDNNAWGLAFRTQYAF